MALSDFDRELLSRCLRRDPGSWEDLVDRYVGLVLHVVNHTAETKSIRLSLSDREDLVAEVMLGLVDDDYAVLRHFRGESSLATYLTVVARRIVVKRLLSRLPATSTLEAGHAHSSSPEPRIENKEEVNHLMQRLDGQEAAVVRLFHLEGLSYQEISRETGVAINSVGPILTRARARMRRLASADPMAR